MCIRVAVIVAQSTYNLEILPLFVVVYDHGLDAALFLQGEVCSYDGYYVETEEGNNYCSGGENDFGKLSVWELWMAADCAVHWRNCPAIVHGGSCL